MKRLPVITLCGFVLFIQLACTSSCNLFKNSNQKKHYKATENFNSPPEIKILTEALSLEHFEKTKGRSFDVDGVYMTNSKYHPVNLFQYGIFSHGMYLRTGEETYKRRCIAQFNYFLDSTRYNRWENCGIGYPYDITFADLKPQWYSGLAQAEAILYLVRYYDLTHDKRALNLIEDTKRFMLTPVEMGGTLKKISDKEVWIEEYANSKAKAEVINGFVTAIMGLHEYTLLFPDDKEAKDILKKCLYTHKKWLNKFDTGTGIYYDQGSKSVVGDFYSKFQVIQMKQMFELFNDTFYKNIEMLWSTYAYGKGTPGTIGSQINDTNFSSPATIKDGWFKPAINYRGLLDGDLVDTILTSQRTKKGLSLMIDNSKMSSYPFNAADSAEIPFIEFDLKKLVVASGWWIQLVPELSTSAGFKIYIRGNDNDAWKKIKTENTGRIESRYIFSFPEEKIKYFKIEFYGLPARGTFSISEINLIVPRSEYITHYTHFISDEFAIADSLCPFSFAKNDVDDFVVFYKTAEVQAKLAGAKWNVDNGIKTNPFKIKGRYCRFLVIFKNNSPNSAVGPIVN